MQAQKTLTPTKTMLSAKSDILFDFWACQRPLTHHWGSGQVFCRFEKAFGKVDVAFGKQDQIPAGIFAVDLNTGYDWNKLPFANNQFKRGYWDPPYIDEKTGKNKLFKNEGIEIWRCCSELAILHTFIWHRAWLKDAQRIGMVAVTMGPMKQIRCLQVFRKAPQIEANHVLLGGEP